jgi:hypothetical protein
MFLVVSAVKRSNKKKNWTMKGSIYACEIFYNLNTEKFKKNFLSSASW